MDIETCKAYIHKVFPTVIIDDVHHDTEVGRYMFSVSGINGNVKEFQRLGRAFTTLYEERQLIIEYDPGMEKNQEMIKSVMLVATILLLVVAFVLWNLEGYREILSL
jgi:hypothetical protein